MADETKREEGSVVWEPKPEAVRVSQLAAFSAFIASRNDGVDLLATGGYDALYQWSVDNVSKFWGAAYAFLRMQHSVAPTEVVDNPKALPGAKWFTGARLNHAQNLLRFRDDRTALVFRSDCSTKDIRLTYRQLYDRVAVLSRALRAAGVRRGDRVGGVMPNIPEAVVAMLAATSIGALWSSCSPDFGLQGVRDRFGQIEPKVVFIADGYFYKGKRIDSMAKLADLVAHVPSIEKMVVVRYTMPEYIRPSIKHVRNGVHYDDFVAASRAAAKADDPIEFEQVPFSHPVYIMYSSGTTGLPKCIVQGAGVVLNHLKELVLHCNCGRDDTLFYFTTTGWMMWNWLVSGLATGCTVVLFDGAPLYPDGGTLWKMAADLKATLFGCSARYLQAVEESGCVPKRDYDISSIRTVMSTGSPATVNTFNFVYNAIGDVQFASISGGTDLNGCFALGCGALPVRTPQLQCRGLGMKVKVYDDEGNAVVGVKGELVCEAAFPSMPLFFWNDTDGTKYRAAYFEMFPGIWRHGDFAELTEHGGMIIHGRSDATLNPGGVRIGTAELYRVLERVPQLSDSVVVGIADGESGNVKVVLFVILKPGNELTDELQAVIRKRLRAEVSPRHVPAVIIQCHAIPYTLSGKKVELAVKKCVEGRKVLNRDALKNPESLDFFVGLAGTL